MRLKIADRKGNAVSEGMIGLFFEDINYAADGGLYAEMLENRSFEFVDCYGDKGDYYTKPAPGYGWSAEGDGAVLEFVTGSPLYRENPHYLRFTADREGAGFKIRPTGEFTSGRGRNTGYPFTPEWRPIRGTLPCV